MISSFRTVEAPPVDALGPPCPLCGRYIRGNQGRMISQATSMIFHAVCIVQAAEQIHAKARRSSQLGDVLLRPVPKRDADIEGRR